MPTVKETNFFTLQSPSDSEAKWYRSLFYDPHKICGEASPNYTKRHLHTGVAERIGTFAPDAKLIYIVRDPVERIRSHYLHNRRNGREKRPFRKAIRSRPSGYVLPSSYYYQLAPFAEHFPREQILLLATEALAKDPMAVWRAVCSFIGVDSDYTPPSLSQRYHVAKAQYRSPKGGAGRAMHRVLRPFVEWHHRVTGRPSPYGKPAVSPKDRTFLEERLASEVDALRRWSGLPLQEWGL